MRLRYLKGLLAGFIFFLLVSPAKAQTMEIGLFGGGSYYLGEMNSWFHFNKTQLAYGASARLNLNPRWAVRLSYYRGGIQGVDTVTTRALPNDFSFKSTVNDISAVAEFNFWEYFTGSKKDYFTPYLFAGVTYYFSDYSSGLAFPFGAGCKLSLSERLALGAELGLRKTFSDELDGVNATKYQSGIDLGADKTFTWDWYNFFGISITYKINLRSKTKCNMKGW
jgi:Domain of unknown function (DUF6089)